MDELESQIAKIQLGNFKSSSSYVHITAEKAGGSDAELYVVSELPLLNPAARDSCEKICLAIASTLKRSYRRPATEASFENTLAQINEELGKLASLGQTHWIDKLNCIIGVKNGKNLTIATCGKVSCFLMRNKEFTDISCSAPANAKGAAAAGQPLKTFENYASGKIRLDDLLILSTTQLLNYLSMDRLRNILTGMDFLAATQTIIEILKENAGPEVAFGTLLNLQVPAGQTVDEEIDLETYVVEKPAGEPKAWTKALNYIKAIFAAENVKRTPKVNLPKLSFAQRIRNLGGNTRDFVIKGKGVWSFMGRSVAAGRGIFSLRNFKELSTAKKFFLISAAVLLIAVVANIFVALHFRQNRVDQEQVAANLKQAQTLLANAQSSFLYNDAAATVSYLAEAKTKLPAQPNRLNGDNKDLYEQVAGQLGELQQKMEKNADVKVTNLGGLGNADNMIGLPDYVAVQVGDRIVSYNKDTGKVEDGALKSPDKLVDTAIAGKNLAAVYDGSNLLTWDYATGKIGLSFDQNVPSAQDFAGMAFYPTNNRIYTINKKTGQIVNFLITNGNLSKPVVAIKDPMLSDAKDLAIDGSIYVLTDTGLNKYQAGKLTDFKLPFLVTPFSGNGKIYTDKDFKDIYLLDPGNNRILIIDKKGNLVATLKAKEFTKLKDFQVDEKSKTIYVLNDSSLLKVNY